MKLEPWCLQQKGSKILLIVYKLRNRILLPQILQVLELRLVLAQLEKVSCRRECVAGVDLLLSSRNKHLPLYEGPSCQMEIKLRRIT